MSCLCAHVCCCATAARHAHATHAHHVPPRAALFASSSASDDDDGAAGASAGAGAGAGAAPGDSDGYRTPPPSSPTRGFVPGVVPEEALLLAAARAAHTVNIFAEMTPWSAVDSTLSAWLSGVLADVPYTIPYVYVILVHLFSFACNPHGRCLGHAQPGSPQLQIRVE